MIKEYLSSIGYKPKTYTLSEFLESTESDSIDSWLRSASVTGKLFKRIVESELDTIITVPVSYLHCIAIILGADTLIVDDSSNAIIIRAETKDLPLYLKDCRN